MKENKVYNHSAGMISVEINSCTHNISIINTELFKTLENKIGRYNTLKVCGFCDECLEKEE